MEFDDRGLEGAQHEDAEADREDRELDVVGLPPHRPEEARAPSALTRGRAWVVLLADRDQDEDADEPGPGKELDEPLEGREVPDDRQPIVRLDQLEEGVDEGCEEHEEGQRREPVGDGHHGEARHPGVPEELLEQGQRPLGRLTGPARIRLPQLVVLDEPGHLAEEQRPPDERDDEAQDERDDLQGPESSEGLVRHRQDALAPEGGHGQDAFGHHER